MQQDTNKKSSRNRLTIDQKAAICQHRLTFPNETQVAIGEWAQKEFGLNAPLSQRTVSNILKDSSQIFEEQQNGKAGSKSSKGSRLPLDDDILDFITQMNDKNEPINRASVIHYAKVVAFTKYKMHELPANKRIKFSEGWLTKVLKRIGCKSRHLHGEASSVELSNESIQTALRKIEEELKDYLPEDILNFDETGLYYEQQPTRTICRTPMGGMKKSKNRLTIGLLTNSDGTYKGHPIVIGRRKTPRGATRRPLLYSKTAVGRPHYVEYHFNASAWMTMDIFRKYIARLNKAFEFAGRKVAILVDNASVHKLKETFSHIKLVFLPPNTTSKLQPLDAGT